MSLELTLARISELNRLVTPAASPVAAGALVAGAAPSSGPPTGAPLVAGTATQSATPASQAEPGTSFAAMLRTATGTPASGAAGAPGIVATAQQEVGQTESPPGSNDSPRIADYRTAVPGGGVGPWCAYFASWVAAQNGTPLGENGQGFARVDDVWAWAQRTARAVPAGPGAVPRPGDLVIWDEHMGIVESVLPDGSIQTIEGNSSDQVARRVHSPNDGIVGYVRMS
jgi:hypothetical protein